MESPVGWGEEVNLDSLFSDPDNLDWSALFRDDFTATLADHGFNLGEM
jgi:hypothetical protein